MFSRRNGHSIIERNARDCGTWNADSLVDWTGSITRYGIIGIARFVYSSIALDFLACVTYSPLYFNEEVYTCERSIVLGTLNFEDNDSNAPAGDRQR